jgi:hypothetical protein
VATPPGVKAGLAGCGGTTSDPGTLGSPDVRNRLCASTFAEYSGTWLYYSPMKATWTCGNGNLDDCNVLQCTNTEWTNYCYVYQCPAGYTCTVGGGTITGPASVDICNCIGFPGGPVAIPDGTPCANLSGTCQGGVCVR